MLRGLSVISVTACLVVCAAGCGRSGAAPTAKAGGTVTWNGQPVANVNVTFTPVGGRPALGTTDAQGKFTLSTFGPNDGAMLGEHTVTLSAAGEAAIPPMPGTPEAVGYKPPPPPFPAKYGSPATTDLKFTVEKGGPNDFQLELKD